MDDRSSVLFAAFIRNVSPAVTSLSFLIPQCKNIDTARQLAPAKEAGLTLRELTSDGFAGSAHRLEQLATGPAGKVYLCHPFLVHSAYKDYGKQPRFIAQPPLLPREPISLERSDNSYSPVEKTILRALGR